MVEKGGVTSQVESKINFVTVEVVNSFKYFIILFSKGGRPQEYVKMRMSKGLKTFDSIKIT